MLPKMKKYKDNNKENGSTHRLKTEPTTKRYPRSNSFLGQLNYEPPRQYFLEILPKRQILTFDKEIKLLEMYQKKLDNAYVERLRIQLKKLDL